jgi:DNA-directed RNA polymerase subunit RPC12/RpoP
MDTDYAAVCMLCGRTVGYVLQGTLVNAPGTRRLEREGRRLRCGYCRGDVFFEPDPALDQPDWIAVMRQELAAGAAAGVSTGRRRR